MRRWVAGLAAVTMLVGACGDSGGDEPIDHPTEPDAVVLRLRTSSGGPPPPGLLSSLRRVPSITVYGDGTVIRPDAPPEAALAGLATATLTEAGIQLILRDAADADLLDGDRFLAHPGLFDFDSFSFTVTANGLTSRVGVYAPGEEGGDDPGMRRKVIAFREQFFGLVEWMGAEMSSLEPMDVERVVVIVPPIDPPFTFGDPEYRDWREADLGDPATYEGRYRSEPCFVLEGDRLAAALPNLASATRDTVWRSGGRDYQVVLRPLLPDEAGCE